MKRKDGVQIYLFQDINTENIIDIKTSQCTGRYGVSKEEKKKKPELQPSSKNIDRVNEKLLDMEHG
jgi:hypothetical protein